MEYKRYEELDTAVLVLLPGSSSPGVDCSLSFLLLCSRVLCPAVYSCFFIPSAAVVLSPFCQGSTLVMQGTAGSTLVPAWEA